MSQKEAQQCVSDTVNWFKRVDDFDTSPGDEEDLQPLMKAAPGAVDETLLYLLESCKGSIWFAEKRGLSADGIVDALQKFDFGENLPFACDEDEEYYLVISSDGEVCEFESEDSSLGDVVGRCFDDYLEEYSKGLMSNKFEYVEDCGLMEKAGSGSHK